MKSKSIISLVVSVIISAAVLASCMVTPKASAPPDTDVTARGGISGQLVPKLGENKQ